MANRAGYRLHVKGNKKFVKEFLMAMQWRDEYENNGVPGVLSCYEDKIIDYDNDDCVCYCSGSCKWSIASSMRNKSADNNIEYLSKRFGLDIEAYSSESLCCFEEHVYIACGNVIIDDCASTCDLLIDEDDDYQLTDEAFDNPVLKAAGITKDNYSQYINEHKEESQDGWLHLGGFDKWSFDYVK